jgi:DNA-binding protein Fis
MATTQLKKANRENLTLRMDKDLQKSLKIQAIEECRSLSDLVEDALIRYFQELEGQETDSLSK